MEMHCGVEGRVVDNVDGDTIVLFKLELRTWCLAIDKQHLPWYTQRRILLPGYLQRKELGGSGRGNRGVDLKRDWHASSHCQWRGQAGSEKPRCPPHDEYLVSCLRLNYPLAGDVKC